MALISQWLSYPRKSQSFAPCKNFLLYGIYLILLSPSTQINFFFLHACTLILAARPPISSRCCFWECAGRSLILKFSYYLYLSNSSLSYFVSFFPSICILLIPPFFSLFPSITLIIPTLSYDVIDINLTLPFLFPL